MRNRSIVHTALVAAGLAFALPTLAATDTTTFQVTATVNDTCAISASDLTFGTYDPNAGDMDATTTVTATCTVGTEYDIGLDTGTNGGSAGSTTRAMSDGSGKYLDYELYTDSARSTEWGNTVGTDTINNPSASAGGNDETVYGRIPGGQYVAAGTYSDTINVTITF